MHGSTRGSTVVLHDRPSRSGLEVDLATGPACGLAGMRRLVGALGGAGADFAGIPARYPTEWAVLSDPGSRTAATLPDLALSASERRLHRESEQTFRVLSVAASAVCQGAESLGMPVVLRGVGRTDLPSLRGLVRAAEYAAATGLGLLRVAPSDAVLVPEPGDPVADTRPERARCLRALGLEVTVEDLQPVCVAQEQAADAVLARAGSEAFLHATATDSSVAPRERVAAALAYGRASFFASNWEGMALVAAACLPAAARLTPADLDLLAAGAAGAPTGGGDRPSGGDDRLSGGDDRLSGGDDQAIEFEPALMRHPGDLSAYLLKLLGIQASFRGRHEEALRFFRAMRELDGRLSAETVAQSHLYSALTLAKRQHRLPEAVAELDAGFAVVRAQEGEPASVRRERGWLHNLRGLTLFRQGDFVAALEHERAALDCVDGMADPSAVHLRVNLVSNISVLQESAGKFDQALQTWQRFRSAGADADPKFVKHHAYRSGGLRIAAGDVAGGVPELAESLQHSVRAVDDFHEYEIAAELGTLMLGRQERTAAGGYFEQAGRAATRLGDPYRMAVASLGRAVACGSRVGEHTVTLARASRTQAAQAAALIDGCREGGDAERLLPAPRTKLNRPFDLVNI